MNIDPAGRVGIGTSSPNSATKLDVSGNIKALGYLTSDGQPGGSADVKLPHPDNPLYYRTLHFKDGLFKGVSDELR